MTKLSAGILLYRHVESGEVEVLIAHMGGPFWSRKDARAWSVPKGEYVEGEEPLAAARREFTEELGTPPPDGECVDLGQVSQSSGKRLTVFALEGDLDAEAIVSNTFELEWPPKSGKIQHFPEIDRAAWVDRATAAEKLVKGQVVFVERLWERVTAP